MQRSLLLLSAILLGGCAFHTSRSSIVVITDNKAVVESCRRIGEIDGRSDVSAILLRDQARDSAIARLKIRGAKLGGTHVLTPVADIKWTGPDTSGVVYACGS